MPLVEGAAQAELAPMEAELRSSHRHSVTSDSVTLRHEAQLIQYLRASVRSVNHW